MTGPATLLTSWANPRKCCIPRQFEPRLGPVAGDLVAPVAA
jgi:hypothetical protein